MGSALHQELPEDDILYEQAPRFVTDQNLARDPRYEQGNDWYAPPEKKRPGTTVRKEPRAHLLPSRLLVVAFILAGAICGIVLAINSGRVFTARQELEDLSERLAQAKTQTNVLENELDGEIPMSDLYDYATGILGLTEAGKDDVTHLDPLAPVQEEAASQEDLYQPTQIRFHLFG